MLAFLLARLIEPSSFAGFGLIGTGIHSFVTGNPEMGFGQIGAGLVAVFIPEGTAPAPSVLDSTNKL